MSYISLYRKYRSQTFDEVIGQEAIIRTLKNAIAHNRLSHAYLFAGPRGTGKTSTARILAKALNCKKGPTPTPCLTCESCLKIKDGAALNVIEIDAASNRGIDEIRDLRERVRYAPVEGKYKVYIIDEVHMLTTEAFNALLKTLEEPPAHVIFVLATTEPQKVPLTISSRCQRFDFGRITLNKIEEHLKRLADQEGLKVEAPALNLIARSAEGSLRDAISLLDQLVSFCEGTITLDDVITILGTADPDLVFEFGEAVGNRDTSKIMELVDKAVYEGLSISQVIKDLIGHFRHLMLAKLGSHSIIEVTSDHLERLKKETERFSLNELKEIIRVLSRAETDIKWHPQARLVLEVALVEISMREPETPHPLAGHTALAGQARMRQAPQSGEGKTLTSSPLHEMERPARHAEQGSAGGGAGVRFQKIKDSWPQILDKVKKTSLPAYISLHEGELLRLEGNKLLIGFKKGFSFHKDRLEEKDCKEVVQKTIKEVTEDDLSISCVMVDQKEPVEKSISVDEVVELFEGKVI